jgi:hypothetical protein
MERTKFDLAVKNTIEGILCFLAILVDFTD